MLFANVCAGFIRSCYGECFLRRFFFLVFPWCLVTWGVLAWLVSLLCTRLGLLRCASCWTCPLGGGRWGHYLCNLWGEYFKIHKTAYMYCWEWWGFLMWKPCMLALAGQPSLHGYCACMVYWNEGKSGEIAGKNNIRPLFSPFWGFSV